MKIESKRLILRNWEDSDVKDIVEGLNNIEVSKWMAVLKSSNKVIGGTEIRNINKKDGTCGGGIWLNEKYQKNGYGTEAFSSRNRYCFDILGLRRIENGYFKGNDKSHNMQLKLGYKDEGVRRKKYFCLATNEYVDECVTGLLKEEFIEWSDKNV